jgi:phosphohistidine phosphatase
MILYLVQHGDSKPKEEDPEQSLSEKGAADVRKIAAFLAQGPKITVPRLLHSGKKRARETAAILAHILKPAEGTAEEKTLEPLADPGVWVNRLAKENSDLMLVGHLPHLSRLAALLLCGDEAKKIVNFQRGGVVVLGRDETGTWSVHWMVIPGLL